MKKETIGVNAGIVWRILSERNSKATFKELLLDTDLNPVELASAIGWLRAKIKLYSYGRMEKIIWPYTGNVITDGCSSCT